MKKCDILKQVMRMIKHVITDEEYEAVKAVEKGNQNKRVDKRLQVIKLRYHYRL